MKDVQFLTSDLLTDAGIRHGWFMKYGGISEGLFESLNGKKGSGDTDENVDENRRRALTSLCHPELVSGTHESTSQIQNRAQGEMQLAFIMHKFKDMIHEVKMGGEYKGYDASITHSKKITLAHATADCGSIIITDSRANVVAVVHGSWHTLSAKIICKTVAKIKMTITDELIAGIGPMICSNCYEFGPEAKDLFDSEYLKPVSRYSSMGENPVQTGSTKTPPHNYFVDLKQMIIDQLHQSGITKIDNLNVCTLEDERFFSHRRSGAHSGRFLTLASL